MAKESKKKALTVDFTDVEGRRPLVPEGDHKVKAVEASIEDGEEHKYIAWVLEVQSGESKGGKLYDNTSLAPKALWRLRTLLEAMGIEVDGKMEIDLDAWIEEGGEFIVTVEHEEYNGKPRPRIIEVAPLDAAEEEEEEKPSKVKGSTKEEAENKKKEEEPEEEEPDFDEMDADELEVFIDEHDLDVDLDDFKKLSAKREAVKEAYEAKSEGGEEKEGEDEKLTVEAVEAMGTKELQGLVDEHELGIELDGSTKSKRRAVIKALKAKKLLAE